MNPNNENKAAGSRPSAQTCSAGFLSRAEGNELRCAAHEIIIRLMEDENQAAINMLKQHCEAALEKLGPLPISEPNA